jgi:hypothetical protein
MSEDASNRVTLELHKWPMNWPAIGRGGRLCGRKAGYGAGQRTNSTSWTITTGDATPASTSILILIAAGLENYSTPPGLCSWSKSSNYGILRVIAFQNIGYLGAFQNPISGMHDLAAMTVKSSILSLSLLSKIW